jgi:hypothetical protein
LANFALPQGLASLAGLRLAGNQLTNIALPNDIGQLSTLDLNANQLTRLTLPVGLTNLTGLYATANNLTNFTVFADMTNLTAIGYLGNPLTSFVLPETLAAASLAGDVAFLQNQGIPIYTYPFDVHLLRPRTLTGAFQFGIMGPPGVYAVLGSVDFNSWNDLGAITNQLGSISFVDVTGDASPRFYRAQLK